MDIGVAEVNLAFVSGPYKARTTDEQHRNIERARDIGRALMRQGWGILCPHMNTAHMDGAVFPDDPVADRQFFLNLYLSIIERLEPGSDVVVLEDGWDDQGWEESSGAVDERSTAINCGIEVFEWPQDEATLARLVYRGLPIVVPVPDSPDD